MERVTLKNRDDVEAILKANKNASFWACFPGLHIFYNLDGKKLYLDEGRILSKRTWYGKKDLRVLFKYDEADKAYVDQLTGSFDYVGYDCVGARLPVTWRWYFEEQFVYSLQGISTFQGNIYKNIRNSYRYFVKHNPDVRVCSLPEVSKDEIGHLLREWVREKNDPVASNARDLKFVNDFYNDSSIIWTFLQNKGEIVGFEASVPLPADGSTCINMIRKTLPSLKQGGEYLQIVQSKKLSDMGILWANDGPKGMEQQMKFKKKFYGGEKELLKGYFYTVKINENMKKDYWPSRTLLYRYR